MFTQDDVNIVAKALPSEAIMEINKNTGISRPTIYKFLRGEKVRSKSQERIYSNALKIIERDKLKEKKFKKQQARIFSIC